MCSTWEVEENCINRDRVWKGECRAYLYEQRDRREAITQNLRVSYRNVYWGEECREEEKGKKN